MSLLYGLSWDTLSWTMGWWQKPLPPTCAAMTPPALLMLLSAPKRSAHVHCHALYINPAHALAASFFALQTCSPENDSESMLH